jgi:4-oxalocrotonate tautomerase
MPLVTIELMPGRSPERKKQLVKAITDLMVDIGGSAREHCWVIFRETPGENWGIGGHLVSSDHFKEAVRAYDERMKT